MLGPIMVQNYWGKGMGNTPENQPSNLLSHVWSNLSSNGRQWGCGLQGNEIQDYERFSVGNCHWTLFSHFFFGPF